MNTSLIAFSVVSASCHRRRFHGSRRRLAVARRVQIELPHLVEQCFVADAEHFRGIFSAPARLLERFGNCFHFSFVFQSTHQRFEPLLSWTRRFFARRCALPRRRHFHQFAQTAFIVLQYHIALHEVLEFAQVAWPWIIHGSI